MNSEYQTPPPPSRPSSMFNWKIVDGTKKSNQNKQKPLLDGVVGVKVVSLNSTRRFQFSNNRHELKI